MKWLLNSRGSSSVYLVIQFAALLVFIVFPIYSAIYEKQAINIKAQDIKDTVDMTNISAYNALQAEETSKAVISFDGFYADHKYKEILAKNLRLNSDLTPKAESLAEGPVVVESLLLYTSGLPTVCPYGKVLKRSTIHSVIKIPVKPSMYRQMILTALGKSYVELHVHVDTELPINN